jgi:CHAD domain-containing protein
MKTIYGYLGIIQNFQLQLKKTNEYVKESLNNIPVSYVSMLEKELDYWKKLSKDFIDASYDFSNDEKDILATLPDKLSSKSIKKFIDYTLYELKTMSGRLDEDEALDNARKYIEDLYYNYSFISPFITQQQANLLNGRSMEESLKLFGDLRDRNVALALLKFCASEELDESEKKLLKEMENEWMNEKKVLKNKLIVTLEAMNIKTNHLKGFVLQK